MTITNMRYIIEIARYKSISKAAKALFMTQSALSNAVKETEDELGIQIFTRTNHGVILSYDGEDFPSYCKEVVAKMDYITDRYKKRGMKETSFSVSCQHLPFAVRAFRALLEITHENIYDFSFSELPFQEILHDVSSAKSELGIFLFRDIQVPEIRKQLYIHELTYTELGTAVVYVFLQKNHPLACLDIITENDLKPYPFITYDRTNDLSTNTEELISFPDFDKYIHVNDRSTKLALLKSSHAFSIGIELSSTIRQKEEKKTTHDLLAIPLKLQDRIETVHVGYVQSKDRAVRAVCQQYITLLKEEYKFI